MTSPSARSSHARAETPVASARQSRANVRRALARRARGHDVRARVREPTNARSVTRHRRRAASNAGRSDAGERAREGERDLNGAVLRSFAFPALAGALFGWDVEISSGALEKRRGGGEQAAASRCRA